MISKKLIGYSRQTLKLQPTSSTTVNPSDIVRVYLPMNTIVDLSSLVFFWMGSTSTSAGFCCFPKNADVSIIQKIDVEIGGKSLTLSCNSWNILANTILDLTLGYDKQNNRSILNGGAPVTALPTANVTNVQYATNNFIGPLASINYLNTYLTGSVLITFTLAPATILVTNATATYPSYQLTNIFFQ